MTRTIRKVTDAEVDSRIEQEQKRVARMVDVTDRGWRTATRPSWTTPAPSMA